MSHHLKSAIIRALTCVCAVSAVAHGGCSNADAPIEPDRTTRSLPAPESNAQQSESLFIVQVEGKMAYIDRTGAVKIQTEFDRVYDYSEGLAQVVVGSIIDSKHGYIDRTGKVVIDLQIDVAGPFRDGLAFVKIGDRAGWIDKSGMPVIAGAFESAGNFSENAPLFE